MTTEEKARAYDEALKKIQPLYEQAKKDDNPIWSTYEYLFPELRESEDENLKNKSGYYKAGKFWKASTLWNATKYKIPQRVPNRYILQECTWNIGTLQRFADEIKNVQEVSLDYPIILDINGNILDGAHRVVKAYLEGKDIDVVYLGDDEWPEPDYDEEKAVRESEDERIRKEIIQFFRDASNSKTRVINSNTFAEWATYLEKQEERSMSAEEVLTRAGLKPYKDGNKWCILAGDNIQEGICGFGDTIDEALYQFLMEVLEIQKKQKPINNSTREKIISRTTSEKQVVLISESNGNAEIGWDTRSLEDTKKLLEYGLAFINKQLNINPVEWSEEEIGHIYTLASYIKSKGYEDDGEFLEGVANKLKSLRPQPKHEWTTYELNTFANCCLLIGAADDSFSKEFKDECIHFLMDLQNKSLRPSWKPSEEQMEALEECGECKRCIKELREQLKKL